MLKQKNNQVKNKKMNIAIVGTGLVGRVLALNLLKDGHTLTLFDKDSKDGLTSAGYTAACRVRRTDKSPRLSGSNAAAPKSPCCP